MLKVFKGVTNFYGNNTVYITDGEQNVQKLPKHNYEVTAIKNTGDDIWITSGVVVALGALCDLPSAISQVKAVLEHLEADLKTEGGTNCPHCGTSMTPTRSVKRKCRSKE